MNAWMRDNMKKNLFIRPAIGYKKKAPWLWSDTAQILTSNLYRRFKDE